MKLSEELINLRQADVHIAEATRRIEHQQALAASLPAGIEKERAEALLAAMRATLVQFAVHREAIVENIARLCFDRPASGRRAHPAVAGIRAASPDER